jgi:capsular exopolysaccharide synthesis family protein
MPPARKPEFLATAAPSRMDLAAAEPTLYLPKVEPLRLFQILLRRGWLLLLGMAVAVAAMWTYLKGAPKIYESVGSVEVSSHAPDVLNIEGMSPEESKDLEQLLTIERNLASSALLLRVARANGLAEAADFAPPGTSEQGLVTRLAKRTRVKLDRGTRVVVIRVEDTVPERAKRLVESLVAEYDLWIKERREDLARRAGEGLAQEEVKLRAAMEAAAARLQAFREDHPVPGLAGRDGGGALDDELGTLNSQLTRTKSERLRLEAEYESFKSFDPADPDSLGGSGSTPRSDEVLAIARALQAKELEFAKVQERYLFKHPVFQEAAREVANLKEDLVEAVRSAGQALEKSYHVALENESKLQGEVDRARTVAVAVEGVRAGFDQVKREADAARELYAKVDTRLRETTLANAVAASAITWSEPPLVPEKAIKPSKRILLPLAGFAGMMAGMMLLVGMELRDGRVRDSAAAARATGVPMLSSLPPFEPGREGDLVLLSAPSSPTAEAFRRLRAALLPPPAKPGARTVLFASAGPGEGRSLCAMNYAASLAMQGRRTLLLDADLRRPGLSRDHLGEGFSGLGDFLLGGCDPAKACFPTALPNLYLLSSGQMRNDAAELLSGTRFAVLLDEAYRWFDVVVIDSPPVLAVSDALAVARYADSTCMVVRKGAGERRGLRKAADLIRSSGGNLVGFVWNEMAFQTKGNPAPEPVVPLSLPALSEPAVAGAVASGTAPAGDSDDGESAASPIA